MMINLNAYDNVIDKIDKTKTWIDVRKKLLLSREIKYRKYHSLLKRYDNKTNTTSYYLAMLDHLSETHTCKLTSKDNYGRVKIRLSEIWKDTYLAGLDKDCNICIKLIESEDDGEVYSFDF